MTFVLKFVFFVSADKILKSVFLTILFAIYWGLSMVNTSLVFHKNLIVPMHLYLESKLVGVIGKVTMLSVFIYSADYRILTHVLLLINQNLKKEILHEGDTIICGLKCGMMDLLS